VIPVLVLAHTFNPIEGSQVSRGTEFVHPMFFTLPLLLFAQAPLLNCEEYDWITGSLSRSTTMSVSTQADIRSVIMEQTDPVCFKREDAND